MKSATSVLQAAIDEMSAERDAVVRAHLQQLADIDREIEVLRGALAQISPAPQVIAVDAALVTAGQRPTVRDLVQIVGNRKIEFTLQDILDEGERLGAPQRNDTVTSIMSRLKREKVVEKGAKRATYRLVRDTPAAEELHASPPLHQEGLGDPFQKEHLALA